jgi:hypothetical protein
MRSMRSGVYAWFKPYRDPHDDTVQTLCQISTFFALVSKIVLNDPKVTPTQADTIGSILIALVIIPPVMALMLQGGIFEWLSRCCSREARVIEMNAGAEGCSQTTDERSRVSHLASLLLEVRSCKPQNLRLRSRHRLTVFAA